MLIRSNFGGISKTIHFWNLKSMGNPKIFVYIRTDNVSNLSHHRCKCKEVGEKLLLVSKRRKEKEEGKNISV